MPASRRRISSRQKLFATAEKSVRELNEWIAGERELTDAQVAARRGFIRAASEESFYFFAKVVLGFELLTNATHKKWADELQAKFLTTGRFMRLKPRGTYKTTLYGVAFLLWVWAVFSPEIRFFYTSANQSLLDEVSAEVDRFIGSDAESVYATVFGVRRDAKLKNTNDVFNVVGKAATRGASLMLRTAGGSTNGIHPHVIVVDDPMDKEDRESEAVRKKKERWFDSLTPLLVPYTLKLPNGQTTKVESIMFIATRWHLKDLVAYILAKPRKWDVEVEGVYDADGTPRYPEFMDEARIREIKSGIADVFFACQYLNNPLPEGSQAFSLARLHKVRPEQCNPKLGTNYNFFDPSQGKSGSDFPASIWVNVLNGKKVIFDAIDRKVELTALIHLIAAKNKELRTKLMRFESNGTMGLENSIKLAHRAIQCPTKIEAMHETRNKEERIQAMQPALYRGDWAFLSTYETAYPELMNQMLFFPAWDHDDFPDVIEKAVTWVENNMPDPRRFRALGA